MSARLLSRHRLPDLALTATPAQDRGRRHLRPGPETRSGIGLDVDSALLSAPPPRSVPGIQRVELVDEQDPAAGRDDSGGQTVLERSRLTCSLRDLRDRATEPLCPCRRAGGGRDAGTGLQPALPLRATRRRQDTSSSGDRLLYRRSQTQPRRPLLDRRDLHQRFHQRAQARPHRGVQEHLPADATCCCSTTPSSSMARRKTAEEFFHTIDTAIASGCQVAITADRPPSAMPLLESRLRERLQAGLLVDLDQPDFQTRLTILARLTSRDLPYRRPARRRSSSTSHASDDQRPRPRVERSPASTAYASLTGTSITLAIVDEVLTHLYDSSSGPSKSSAAPTVDQIQAAVSEALDVAPADLVSARRNRRLVYARQIAMYLSRELTDLFAARDRISIRRTRSHHRAPRPPQDQEPDPDRGSNQSVGRRVGPSAHRRLTTNPTDHRHPQTMISTLFTNVSTTADQHHTEPPTPTTSSINWSVLK